MLMKRSPWRFFRSGGKASWFAPALAACHKIAAMRNDRWHDPAAQIPINVRLASIMFRNHFVNFIMTG